MKNTHRLGRPPVLTENCVRKLEEAFCLGFNTRQTCQIAKVSRSTLYKYFSENPTFRTHIEDIKPKEPFRVYIPIDARFIVHRWLEAMQRKEDPSTEESTLWFKLLQQYYGQEKVYAMDYTPDPT